MKKCLILLASLIGIACSGSAFSQFNPSNGFSTINNQCGTFFLQGSTYYNNYGVSVGSSLPVCAGALSTQLGSNVLITGGSVSGLTVLSTASYTVATLPTCNTAAKGEILTVTDASSPTYNGTLTGSSTTVVPVFCNGSAWTSH